MTAEEVMDMVTQVLNQPPALLGTYTLPGGSVIPAVGIGDITPDDWETQGLEVTVPLVPDSDNVWTSKVVRKDQSWDLILVQHDTPVGVQGIAPSLPQAVQRLEQFFPVSNSVPLPALGEFGNLPQCRVTFAVFDTPKVLNRVYTKGV